MTKALNTIVTVPGSKSVTNRALLFAALADGISNLSGVLFSDDSRHFLGSLKSLGFEVDINEAQATVSVRGCGGSIPNKSGSIDVGSAGTAARFLTAMLALSDGEYTINCSEQMKARPMEALFTALTELGASFTYLEKENYLPVKVIGRKKNFEGESKNGVAGSAFENSNTWGGPSVHIDISKSTQFLSALMMTSVMVDGGMDIFITSEKTDGSYIRITSAMMKDFGCEVIYDGHDYHIAGGQTYKAGDYYVEPDVSAACYFYAMAALTGGKVAVKGIHPGLMQGDMRFFDVLDKMGCDIYVGDKPVKGEKVVSADSICSELGEEYINKEIFVENRSGQLSAIDIDMNNFSDQALTLSVLAAYAKGDTHIRNISHIKLQECDRMAAMLFNLRSMGIECSEDGDGVAITGGKPHAAVIKTFDDHRVSMSFAMAGTVTEGIVIEDPLCCRKTFENYYDVLESLY